MPFKHVTMIQPTPVPFTEMVGTKELPYPELLKKVWAYWKLNKLTRAQSL